MTERRRKRELKEDRVREKKKKRVRKEGRSGWPSDDDENWSAPYVVLGASGKNGGGGGLQRRIWEWGDMGVFRTL